MQSNVGHPDMVPVHGDSVGHEKHPRAPRANQPFRLVHHRHAVARDWLVLLRENVVVRERVGGPTEESVNCYFILIFQTAKSKYFDA